ncbi:outer membrane beta-barrel protein [Granulicella sp. dw_53]|uniref:outer membrane beta-barrel protein n=1 Tax=Granulicella sp. dw_53 TaxID=2719792 RepID=UPI001BD4A085|nr:outer membrane beta-barrel protein [Granulicella sp. dw_53]
MQMMISTIHTGASAKTRATSWMVRTAALAFVAAIGAVTLSAQSTTPAASQPSLDLRASLAAPLDLSAPEPSTYSSSAVSSDLGTPAADAPVDASASLNFADPGQPPPRRRYGSPRYADRTHNADGSNKLAFMAGAGFTVPVGNTSKYLATSYAFQVGAGYNLNKKFGVMAQFDWDNFGFQSSTLNNQLALYNSLDAGLSSLGGHSHVWSFSLNPTYTFAQREKIGGYVVAGVGFYHKTADFTVPTIALSCNFFGQCFQVQADQSIDRYTSNAPGFSGGFGLTYKLSRFANEKLYMEARYVFVDNDQRFLTGTNANNTPPNSTAFNAFPANSNRTGYVPITFGIRW